MSEHEPHGPNGGAEKPAINNYGTDDPAEQARIERARADASAQRRRNRERLERLVDAGLNPEDAQAVIEFEDAEREQRETAAETGERETQIRPRIFVRSLVDYNDGHDIGDWIDANQDADELHEEIQRILARSLHAHWTGQPSEEWAIHDHDGFGRVRLSEYESLEVVSMLAKGIAEHGPAYAAWAEINDARDTAALSMFEDAYKGRFESRTAFAEQVVADLDTENALRRAVPEWLGPFVQIDYEAVAHAMEIDGDVRFVDREGGGVWVFDGRV